MPSTSRTHNNENRLTKTILLVNFCFVITWLPNCVLGIYESLIDSNTVNASSDFVAIIKVAISYLSMGTYFNGGLNGFIYSVRLARIREFYKNAFRNFFVRNAQKQNLRSLDLHNTIESSLDTFDTL